MKDIKEAFNLEENNFRLDPKSRQSRCFAETSEEIRKHVFQTIEKAIRQKSAPKAVIYGTWGSGKTHILHHIAYVYSKKDIHVVVVDCPNLERKSRYSELHTQIISEIGKEYVIKHIRMKLNKINQENLNPEDANSAILEFFGEEELAHICGFLGSTNNREDLDLCWKWLRGDKLTKGEGHHIYSGIGNLRLTTKQAVRILRLLGKLSKEFDDKILLIAIDEMEIVARHVEDSDAWNDFLSAMMQLVGEEQQDVGIIVSCTLRGADETEQLGPFNEEQVKERIGHSNYVPIETVDDFKEFVKEVISYVRGDYWVAHKDELDGDSESHLYEKAKEKMEWVTKKVEELKKKKVDISVDFYPFENKAIEEFERLSTETDGGRKPRNICKNLSDFASEAVAQDKESINVEIIEGIMALMEQRQIQ